MVTRRFISAKPSSQALWTGISLSQHHPPSRLPNSWSPPRRGSNSPRARRGRSAALDGAVRLAQLGDVAAEDVLDLGDQQLLVLLLVLDAGDDEEAEAVEVRVRRGADQLLDPAVHRLAEAVDLVVARPGHQPPVVAADAGPERLVVRVHDEFQPRVLGGVEAERLQQVLGEEPGGMAEVPPRRADVRHRLDAVVLGMKRLTELDAQRAGLAVAVQQVVSVHGAPSRDHCSGHRPGINARATLETKSRLKPAPGFRTNLGAGFSRLFF